MLYASTNNTEADKTKTENNYDNGRNKFKNYMKKSRTWGHPDVFETTGSNSNESVVQQNCSHEIRNITQPTHNKKKTNWYKLSDFNSNMWENPSRKLNFPSTSMKTDPEKLAALPTNHTVSIDLHNVTLQKKNIEKNIVNNNPPDKTSDAAHNIKNDSNNFLSDIEEKRRLRRERQKVKKEKKKEEKAILREEEIRKKKLLPKSQKVTIIDHSTLDKFLLKDAPPPNAVTKEVTYTGDEFPSLGEVCSAACHSVNYKKKYDYRVRKSSAREASSEEKQTPEETETSTLQVGSRNHLAPSRFPTRDGTNSTIRNKSLQRQTEFEFEQITENTKKATKFLEEKGKRPKRRDPIQLDINEILKVQETKHEVTVKMHASKMTPKTEMVRYSGNILDSDNPERKRGKQREVPKARKPSNLKQIILQERAKRKEARLRESKTQEDGPEKNLSSDTDKPNTEDFLASYEGFPIGVYTQEESINSTENELEANSQNRDSENITKVHAQIDGNIHLQLGSTSVTERNIDEQYKDSSQNRCAENCNNVEGNSLACQQSLKTDVAVTIDTNKAFTRKIHSRKFRDYCDHYITPEILTAATALLEDIVKFHDRQYARSPLKASAKRRHVTGLKEVRRFLTLRRIRLLVVAPDLEHNSTSGGLDDIVAQLKENAAANCVPYVFALGRRQLGYILKKKVPVSCVGVLNYDGTENNFRDLMSAVEKAREDYKLTVSQISPLPEEMADKINGKTENKETTVAEDDVNKEVVASLLAKLTMTRASDDSSPFLDAIKRCNSLESDYEDEISVQEQIF